MKTLVLGLGNQILSDDGVGIRVVQELNNGFFAAEVTMMEASVAGLDFLDLLTHYDRAIIVDAIQTRSGTTGQIYRLEPEAFIATQHASSPHDVNFATALELGRRLGIPLPRRIIIYGIEVADVATFSEKCTPEIEKIVPDVVNMVKQELINGSD